MSLLHIYVCLLNFVCYQQYLRKFIKKYVKKCLNFFIVFATVEDCTGGGVCGCFFCVQGAFHVLDNEV